MLCAKESYVQVLWISGGWSCYVAITDVPRPWVDLSFKAFSSANQALARESCALLSTTLAARRSRPTHAETETLVRRRRKPLYRKKHMGFSLENVCHPWIHAFRTVTLLYWTPDSEVFELNFPLTTGTPSETTNEIRWAFNLGCSPRFSA